LLSAAIEGAGGEQLRNQKALVDQMQKARMLQSTMRGRPAVAHKYQHLPH